MKTSSFIAVSLAALMLAGCASLFGGGRHLPGPRGPGGPDGPGPKQEPFNPPRNILIAYDANKDGTLTRAELEAGLKAEFDHYDVNGNRCLDTNEVAAINAERWKTDASTTSPLIDWNADGCVDFSEYAGTARSLFSQFDADGDGVLTPDELNPRRQRPPRRVQKPMPGQDQDRREPPGG